MRILVTGGAGFIASHVTDAYVEQGHQVLVVDDLSTGRRENLNAAAHLEQLDVASPRFADLVADFSPETINHHAAQVSVRDSVEDPLEDARRNVLGSANVMEAAWRHGVGHVIYASSGGAIYGEPAELPAAENAPILPVSPYGLTKYAGELYGEYYARMHNLCFTALRYANVYGPRQDPLGEAGVVAIFSNSMLSGGEPIINGEGTQVRDYVFVGDVVRANVLAIETRKKGAYNIGTGIPTSVNDLFALLRNVTGFGGGEQHGPPKAGDAQANYLDASLARKELGWEAQTSLDEGLACTVAFFRERISAPR